MALNKCCFCLPLSAGTLVIASLHLFVNISTLLGWGIFTAVFYSEQHRHRGHRGFYIALYIFLGLLLLCGINIACDSALIHGVRKKQRKFMLPWVVWYGIFTTAMTLAWFGTTVWLAVIMSDTLHTESAGIGVAFFCISLVCGVILFTVMWFWYAAVLSYYNQLAPSDTYVMETLRAE